MEGQRACMHETIRNVIYFQSFGEQQVCCKITCRRRKDTQEDREETHLLKHEVRAFTCECVGSGMISEENYTYLDEEMACFFHYLG